MNFISPQIKEIRTSTIKSVHQVIFKTTNTDSDYTQQRLSDPKLSLGSGLMGHKQQLKTMINADHKIITNELTT